MKRQTFLKLGASAAVAGAWRIAVPWDAAAAIPYVSFAGALYRAGGGGKIEKSTNGGRNWKLHSDLGDMYSIKNLAVDHRNLRVTVGFHHRTFSLVLARNKRSWLLTA